MTNNVFVHIAFVDVYRFAGWDFEWRRTRPISPWPLKKDGEPRSRAGLKFYKDISPFLNMSDKEQDKFLIGVYR